MPTDLTAASEAAHRTSIESTPQQIAGFLQEVLGQGLVAYMTGQKDVKTVGRWAAGQRSPRTQSELRLRQIYQAFQLLQMEESTHTIVAWFGGLNPQLDDESPARAFREGRDRDVIVAAKSFLAGG